MNSNSSALVVPPPPSPPIATTNDIRAIKPPVEIPNDWAWVWWVLGSIVVAALITAALIWYRKKRAQPVLVPVVPPHIRAKQKLQAALGLIHDPRLFCIEVSTIERVYLEERFNFRAPERTTEEFLIELQSTDLLLPDQKLSLSEFLQSCDLVKFARFEPTEATLRELHNSALRLVDETQFEAINAAAAATSAVAMPPAVTQHATRNTP
jgi:hypothetical protein